MVAKTGDAEVINLWAGQATLAEALPAAEITRGLAAEARAAIAWTESSYWARRSPRS